RRQQSTRCSDVEAPAALREYSQRWERSGGRANLEAGTLRNICVLENCPARNRSQDRRGKPTHTLLGKPDDTVEETGASTRCTAGVGDPASRDRLWELTSGNLPRE